MGLHLGIGVPIVLDLYFFGSAAFVGECWDFVVVVIEVRHF